MREYRILVNNQVFICDWQSCENLTIQDMQELEASLNELYPKDWQIVFR